MRYFVFIVLAAVAMVQISFALVDAKYRTTVGVWANAWDERDDDDGCSPDGCTADLTRDNSRREDSRWSCSYDLEDKTCKISYSFAEPQDIVRVRLALWKGDERVRKIKMTFYDTDGGKSTKTFTSSGTTEGYESITVNTDETYKMTMVPVDLDDDEWLSILEMSVFRDTSVLDMDRCYRISCISHLH